MTYDVARKRLTIFGGMVGPQIESDETWTWDGASWTKYVPVGPSPRSGHAMVYDAARARVLLFGGADAFGTELGGTWEWDGAAWTELNPAGAPSERLGHRMVYDSVRERVLLFGGRGDPGTGTGTWLNDTWAWDGVTWSDVTPALAADSPPPRAGHGLAYDSDRDRVVMFGGRGEDALDARFDDTWEWDGLAWANVSPVDPSNSPSERDTHAMVYNPMRERVVLFGGAEFEGWATADGWEWDGAVWTPIIPLGSDYPLPRTDSAMAYIPVRGRTVVFGGTQTNVFGNTTAIYSDAWEWSGTTWNDVSADVAPRYATAMAYDAARGRLLMFGGTDCLAMQEPQCTERLADTWLFAHRAVGPEACHTGFDGDGDGLIGCADPDCWGYCTPLCAPGSTPAWPDDCDLDRRHCGDGFCDENLESYRLCPQDCSAPPPICGDFLCEGGETAAACPGDCSP